MLNLSFSSPRNAELPFVPLCLAGREYPFILDTGATMSSVGRDYEGPLSTRFVSSVGIEGVPFDSSCTPPLPVICTLDPSLRFSHSFIFMPECPFNLLGRDLMSLLGLSISFSGSHMIVDTPDGAPPDVFALSSSVLPHNILNAACTSQALSPVLSALPNTLWADHKDDVGSVSCSPYEAVIKHSTPVYVKQYPLSPSKLDGIDNILQSLLQQGVVVPCVSPYNTPVNLVPKPDGTWRLTQDLRKINELIVPVAPVVPDVPSLMSSIPCDHAYFSVIDLCSAFFSVPVGHETQPLFAFTHRGRQYTWTRLPQGFIDSPAVFTAVLRDALADLCLPRGSTVLQYADDLLVTAEDQDACAAATLSLLTLLAQKGFKVSRTKLQFCLTTVRYLGHDLSQGSRRLSPERVQVIMDTQAAELYALTRACILAQDTDVTIYTDSRYAFGVAHDFGRIWASRGFTTADGKPISHSSLVTDLITACLLPCTLAIVKTRAHTRGDSFEVKGNSFADRVAKAAAASGVLPPGFNCALVSTDRMVSAVLPDIDLISIQASASVADTQFWDAQGATEKSGVLLDAQGRLCLPRHCTPFLVREFHGPTHRGRRGVVEDMNRTFCINNLHTDAHNILDKCLTCAQNNLSKPGVVHQHLPIPDTPFQEWQIDFTHMPKQGPFKYLLVMIDKFSRWIEAFPCSKENARTAVNKLTQEIIPRYGLPVGIDSDKGTPFTSKVTQELCKDLKINWRFHIPYHPQSSGIVERANRTIKGKLRKAMQDAGTKNWVQVLPLVLADMRMTAQVALDNLSPYELVMGCPFPVPWRRGMQVIGTGDLEVHLSEYAVGLMRVLDEYWARVNSKKPPIPEAHTHPFEVGDRVLVKRFAKLNAPMEESPYSGPTDVLAVTRTAVLTDLFPQWIHASRIKKAPM
ncbi:uncharacterized protein LOC132874382 isoform X1 [Neoarius graeffei]|uniref:uncharacterized protein LOC132874382 isoform X1 n=2 Tax=Neoarius graeffei TaxID=443677 RepID=UPI00298C117E|nr:uncharacterized protein LOC132874382 isoform X1 [Neoarius graeffei]XP_060766503.1 uncharacterized protein LOC132874382 isoform X1 [Neoarius graeffei]XP_060766504.1 uncharacterized protein LOC132874382 isoform X1 [Neoarius graeffei]XP_060766505.1 uncharacterized protein LOC132874382 isoform X1 [Neoarius graeffei]XP_060766506.1 uncharacterized protein LOC132874382 isoform X1 [Neoarius graeffei]XP_060766507.1 uncharacterized protein LOC132874382 isoform X1 [Neoarius graeffei]